MLKKTKEGIGSLWQNQVRFVDSLDSKKFVFFCVYLFGFYQLGKPVCLHLWATTDMTSFKEVTQFWAENVLR